MKWRPWLRVTWNSIWYDYENRFWLAMLIAAVFVAGIMLGALWHAGFWEQSP